MFVLKIKMKTNTTDPYIYVLRQKHKKDVLDFISTRY